MKATFDQHIGIFEDAVPKEWCENIINIFENPGDKQPISRQMSESDCPLTVKDDLQMGLYLLDSGEDLCNEFTYNFFNIIYPLYSTQYKINKQILPPDLYLTDFKVQKTLPGGGYHVWHIEHDEKASHRLMAYTLYLNDIEEGGETEFLIQSKRVTPKQGTICIFPSFYTHIHRGNPPLSKEKYIITGWIELSPNKGLPPKVIQSRLLTLPPTNE